MEPLETLFDPESRAPSLLSPELARLYGGGLTLPDDVLYANFVSSLDGVVALEGTAGGGPAAISLHSEPDRFVMGLLRVVADAVLLGAGTLRDAWKHHWTPAHIYPDAARLFAALERADPELVIVTLRGDIDPAQPTLEHRVLILTTDAGRARLGTSLPSTARVRSLGPDAPSGRRLRDAVRAEGHRRILTEGGPTVIGLLLSDGVLDELFLTLSPVLAGREGHDSARLSLVEGLALPPDAFATGSLRSVRRHGHHLFLRYAFREGS
ncbi:MAG: dihydrofolate reductase family protein [Candidatus Dormibacteraeota bacterium]|nr:dihydrofolate reductase family protein [Candidatus Dormibacteraeota bacterium]